MRPLLVLVLTLVATAAQEPSHAPGCENDPGEQKIFQVSLTQETVVDGEVVHSTDARYLHLDKLSASDGALNSVGSLALPATATAVDGGGALSLRHLEMLSALNIDGNGVVVGLSITNGSVVHQTAIADVQIKSVCLSDILNRMWILVLNTKLNSLQLLAWHLEAPDQAPELLLDNVADPSWAPVGGMQFNQKDRKSLYVAFEVNAGAPRNVFLTIDAVNKVLLQRTEVDPAFSIRSWQEQVVATRMFGVVQATNGSNQLYFATIDLSLAGVVRVIQPISTFTTAIRGAASNCVPCACPFSLYLTVMGHDPSAAPDKVVEIDFIDGTVNVESQASLARVPFAVGINP